MLRIITASLALVATASANAEKLVLVVGPPTTKLNGPFATDFDHTGVMWFVEMPGHKLLKLDLKGDVATVAGTGAKGNTGDGGPGPAATFNGPHHLAVTPYGRVFVADTFNNRIRVFDPKTGTLHAAYGTGKKAYSGDGGPADKAEFSGVHCIALDPAAKSLTLADLDNRRVRRIDLFTGVVTLVAGNGKKGTPKDGSIAVDSPLVDPRATAVDASGNVYILERGGHCLRVVDPQGKIRTVAGTGKPGPSVEKVEALKATFRGPKHLCVDRAGDVLICDSDNHCVRKYSVKDGTVERIAGTGKKGDGGLGGDPKQAGLNQPHGVFVHPTTGEIYIADSSNNRIVRIEK